MESNLVAFSLLMVLGVFIAGVSQTQLKRSAREKHKSPIHEYLNIRVITAYAFFAVSAAITMFVLRHIPVTLAAVLESTGYIFVPVLASFFLGEKLNKKQKMGMAVIIIGIVVFNI